MSCYASVSTKQDYNRLLEHYRLVPTLLEQMDKGHHFIDALLHTTGYDRIEPDQILSLLSSILIDKFSFKALSFNLGPVPAKPLQLFNALSKLDLNGAVILCHMHAGQLALFNPKDRSHFSKLSSLPPRALVVTYLPSSYDFKALSKSSQDSWSLLKKWLKKAFEPDEEKAPIKTPLVDQKPKPQESSFAPSPQYRIMITNEFFHNGNLEAWKNILQSFSRAHPDREVLLFYRSEPITNLYSLFSWGKVRFGDEISFIVKGGPTKDTALLKRCLSEGASPHFSRYIKKDIHRPLTLFQP